MSAYQVISVVSDSLQPFAYLILSLLSMEFTKQKYWSRLPCPFLGNLLNPGIELTSIPSPALSGRFLTLAPWEAHFPQRLYQVHKGSIFFTSFPIFVICLFENISFNRCELIPHYGFYL